MLPNATQGWLSSCAGQFVDRAASIDIWLTVQPSGQVKDARAVNDSTPFRAAWSMPSVGRLWWACGSRKETRIALRLALSKTA